MKYSHRLSPWLLSAGIWAACVSSSVWSSPAHAQSPQVAPHGFHEGAVPTNISSPDPKVPQREVRIQVLSGERRPLAQVEVELITQFESVAEGKSTQVTKKTTDAEGYVSFSGLDTALHYTYGARALYDGAIYDVPPFRLTEEGGHHIQLHVYPATTDLKQAFVGIRGFVLVELREDQFQFDVLYRVINMSRMTWIPEGISLRLPSSAQAFDGGLTEGGSGFQLENQSAVLRGTFPPGQRDVRYQFQVPSKGQDTQFFSLDVPPHTAELRVLVEATPHMKLLVPGFEPAEFTKGPEGKNILITRRVMQPGQSELRDVTIELQGLPVPSKTRWLVSGLAAFIALAGLVLAWVQRRKPSTGAQEETQAASQVLLQELVALEAAFRREEIGPRTYERAKKQLLDSLARLKKYTVSTSTNT